MSVGVIEGSLPRACGWRDDLYVHVANTAEAFVIVDRRPTSWTFHDPDPIPTKSGALAPGHRRRSMAV
jgi:hypothetical protein